MNREQLIDKAAKAMPGADNAPWEDLSEVERDWARRDARAALAVFEEAQRMQCTCRMALGSHAINCPAFEEAHAPTECPVCHRSDGSHKLDCRPQNRRDAAHAPTDDERKWLDSFRRWTLEDVQNSPRTALGAIERLVAHIDRRTVQSEPSAARILAATKAIHAIECGCGYDGEHSEADIERREQIAHAALRAAAEAEGWNR